ncbi:hypothetical protein [Agromyces sp. GXS1127]|uniref:hypothetical protein n=1 Tax=Agromyces sp. GXS1127 TaxID=3424181 RepID=UPI003D310209
MDWTFWIAGIVIIVLVVVTQVFFHESRWSRRPREDEPFDDDGRPDDGRPGRGDDPDGGSR